MSPIKLALLFVLGALFLSATLVQGDDSEQNTSEESSEASESSDTDVSASADSNEAGGDPEGMEGESDGSEGDLVNGLSADMENELDAEESGSARRRRSAGYGGYGSYGSYGGYGGQAGYGGYGYSQGHGDSYGRGYGSYGGSYGGGYGGSYGGHGGSYGGQGYGKQSVSYDKSHTKAPVVTFVKGFKPGKSYVEKGKIVRNYYRHGTYEVALQHYKFIPVIKVVPYTTYDTVGYTGHVQAHNDYTAVICKDCYHGYPKIDLVANKAPYNYLTRRFVYLPENFHVGNNNNRHG